MEKPQNFQNKSKETGWLSAYKKDVTSQGGEDGITEKIFAIIKDGDGWCVEFGAWDGKQYSNTWNLIQNKGWSGVVIEANPEKYKELVQTYSNNNKVTCINKFVNFELSDTLDDILSKTQISKSFDLLAIDVDGNDYHIWESITHYKPKVIIIEFNRSIPVDIEFIQPRNTKINQGSSLLSLYMLAKKKNYELIAITDCNAFFVDKKYFELFDIQDNSLSLFHKNRECETQLFQLYDGTLVLSGCKKLYWHGIEINQKKIQTLPKFLREYPGNPQHSLAYRLLFRFYYITNPRVIFFGIIRGLLRRIRSALVNLMK